MDELKTYTDAELKAELERLDTLFARKRHASAQFTIRCDAVAAAIEKREEGEAAAG